MEQISEKLGRRLPFAYFFFEILLRCENILNGKIEEKEANVYRSYNFFLQKEYIRNIYANS